MKSITPPWLPSTPVLLLGPGPSPVSDRVQTALTASPRSHLDPEFVTVLDEVRAGLGQVFQAPSDNFSLALSGTGTTAMDASAANFVEPGSSVLCVVNGYFGARLADVLSRQGAFVERLESEWGRAIDPVRVERATIDGRFDLVAVVHGETSTGVLNPVQAIASIAHKREAMMLVDAVTSLGTVPVDVSGWGIEICYSCSQKGIGAPAGLAPMTVSERSRVHRVHRPSFALDLDKLEDFWVRRQYHHTISAPLIYALRAALADVQSEGLPARWARHQAVHEALVRGLGGLGLELLPPPGQRLPSLNAVRVPEGVDAAAVRDRLLAKHRIEIGAGLGPLAGKIWRIGLMGAGATLENVERVVAALGESLRYKPKKK